MLIRINTNNQAIQLLNKYLDDNDYRNKMGERALTWTRDKLLFKNNMIEMSNYIDDLVKRLPNLKKSKKINDIKQMIKESLHRRNDKRNY